MTINKQLGIASNNDGSYGFLGIAQPKDADANTLKDVRSHFPAPANCADAQEQYSRLQASIADNEGKITRGETDRVGKRYRIAYNVVLGELESYIAGDACKVKPPVVVPDVKVIPKPNASGNTGIVAPATDATATDEASALVKAAAEKALAAAKKKKLLLYGGIGLAVVVVGGVVIWKLKS